MTKTNDSQDRASRYFPHAMSEMLTRYFSMTAPGRSRHAAATLGTSSPQTRSRVETQRRAEELWDTLADFA
jgi:hypothetical protein